MTTPSGTRPLVLVLNSGSSSLKYQLIDVAAATALASGLVERIGEETGSVRHTVHSLDGQTPDGQTPDGQTPDEDRTIERHQRIAGHDEALRVALRLFTEVGPDLDEVDLRAVGHRVVQGGARYFGPVLVDEQVIHDIDELAPLAPLHNPANLTGIRVAGKLLPHLPQVAVFDTAFFADLPAAAATYALDREVAQRYRVRRYGAHGTSHQYVAAEAAQALGRPLAEVNLIVLHLGNGASASAIRAGRPADTSMGMTPLEGLVMGTRTGDIDAAVIFHLARHAGLSIDRLDELVNFRSGLKGLAGVNDFRELQRLVDDGDEQARLALDVYVHRLRKYVGAYTAVLGTVDALVFTAGVVEHSAMLRELTCRGLEPLGYAVDPERNVSGSGARVISPAGSRAAVLVVPTNEELAIARQTLNVIGAR